MAYYLKYPPEKGHEKTTSSPHFSSEIVERGKRERARNSPHARKARRGSLKSQKVAQSLNETMRK